MYLLRILAILVLFSHAKVHSLSLNSFRSQERMDFWATTSSGLESVLANEIKQLRYVSRIKVSKGGVAFQGTETTGFDALLWLRTSLKLMEKVGEADGITNRQDLYSFVAGVDWLGMIDPIHHTIKCDCTIGRDVPTDIAHTHFSSLTLKNAITDKFRDNVGVRPSVNTTDPTLLISVYLHRGSATLYRVWSGERSMHKRGYRQDSVVHKAAMREATAAAL
jgi:putative N6-adenine-specific DNA methylase